MKKVIVILIMLIVLGGVGLGVYSFYEQQTTPPVGSGIKYYNSLDGSVIEMETSVYNEGSELELKAAAAPNGYTFAGWYDNANFFGEPIAKISTTQTGAVTLFAKFTPNTYAVTYKIDGTAAELAANKYVFGQGVILTQPAARPGYTFSGWKAKADLSGDVMTAVGITETGAKEFFGAWTANDYAINYVIDGEPAELDADGYVFAAGVTLSQPVVRAGYTFSGWFSNEDLEGDVVTAIGVADLGDKTFYGAFTANSYAVSYMLDGEAIELENDGYVFGEGLALSVPAARAGYTFSGWKAKADLSGDVMTAVGAAELGDKTFYGVFTANVYTVSYFVDGYELGAEFADAYTFGIGVTLSVPAAVEGFAFSGWFSDAEMTGDAITAIGATELGDKTFYGVQVSLFKNIVINAADVNPETMVAIEVPASDYDAFDALAPSFAVTYLLDGVESTVTLELVGQNYLEDRSSICAYSNMEQSGDPNMNVLNIMFYLGLDSSAFDDDYPIPDSALDNLMVMIVTALEYEQIVITDIVAAPIETYTITYYMNHEIVREESYTWGDEYTLWQPEVPEGAYRFEGWFLAEGEDWSWNLVGRTYLKLEFGEAGNRQFFGDIIDTSLATLSVINSNLAYQYVDITYYDVQPREGLYQIQYTVDGVFYYQDLIFVRKITEINNEFYETYEARTDWESDRQSTLLHDIQISLGQKVVFDENGETISPGYTRPLGSYGGICNNMGIAIANLSRPGEPSLIDGEVKILSFNFNQSLESLGIYSDWVASPLIGSQILSEYADSSGNATVYLPTLDHGQFIYALFNGVRFTFEVPVSSSTFTQNGCSYTITKVDSTAYALTVSDVMPETQVSFTALAVKAK